MIIAYGFIICIGMLLILIKLPQRQALTCLGHHLWLDLGVTVLAFLMHMGTFSGVMAAAVAGLLCSMFTTAARWLVGYIRRGTYTPGVIDLKVQLPVRPRTAFRWPWQRRPAIRPPR